MTGDRDAPPGDGINAAYASNESEGQRCPSSPVCSPPAAKTLLLHHEASVRTGLVDCAVPPAFREAMLRVRYIGNKPAQHVG